MALQHYISLVVLLVAAATDLRKGLIYNWLTLPAIVVGLVLSTWQGGSTGLGLSMLGILVGGGALFLFFIFGAMGGGDVKLMAAVGALMGPYFVGETLVMSILAGGLTGIGLLLVQGKFMVACRWYLKSLTACVRAIFIRGIGLVLPKNPEVGTAPFGLSILIGAVSAYYFDVLYYFRSW